MRDTVGWRRCCISATVLCLVTVACTGTSDEGAGRRWSDAAGRELLDLAARDQEVRKGFGPETVTDTAFMGRMARTDSANTRRLKELVDSLGWPSDGAVDTKALEGAFLLVQHATDPEFQARMEPLIEADVKAGRLDAQDYALLVDRTRQKSGQLQLYGTQLSIAPGTKTATLDPIADSASVDDRRRALGLPSLGEYLDSVHAQTGFEIEGRKPAGRDGPGGSS